jgi:hypothetical protein
VRKTVLPVIAAGSLLSLHTSGLGWVASATVTVVALVIGLALAANLLRRAGRLGTMSLSIARITHLMNRQGMLAADERVAYANHVHIVDANLSGAPVLSDLLSAATHGVAARLNAQGNAWLCHTDRQLIVWGPARQHFFDLGRIGAAGRLVSRER